MKRRKCIIIINRSCIETWYGRMYQRRLHWYPLSSLKITKRRLKNTPWEKSLSGLYETVSTRIRRSGASDTRGYSTKFSVRGRLRSGIQPLAFNILFLTEKAPLSYTFYWQMITFHIRSLELCILFNCCKCTDMNQSQNQNSFVDFFTPNWKFICLSDLGFFTDANDRFPHPFLYLRQRNPYPFLYLKPEKDTPFGGSLPV